MQARRRVPEVLPHSSRRAGKRAGRIGPAALEYAAPSRPPPRPAGTRPRRRRIRSPPRRHRSARCASPLGVIALLRHHTLNRPRCAGVVLARGTPSRLDAGERSRRSPRCAAAGPRGCDSCSCFGRSTNVAARPISRSRVIALGRWTLLPRRGKTDAMVFETNWSGALGELHRRLRADDALAVALHLGRHRALPGPPADHRPAGLGRRDRQGGRPLLHGLPQGRDHAGHRQGAGAAPAARSASSARSTGSGPTSSRGAGAASRPTFRSWSSDGRPGGGGAGDAHPRARRCASTCAGSTRARWRSCPTRPTSPAS